MTTRLSASRLKLSHVASTFSSKACLHHVSFRTRPFFPFPSSLQKSPLSTTQTYLLPKARSKQQAYTPPKPKSQPQTLKPKAHNLIRPKLEDAPDPIAAAKSRRERRRNIILAFGLILGLGTTYTVFIYQKVMAPLSEEENLEIAKFSGKLRGVYIEGEDDEDVNLEAVYERTYATFDENINFTEFVMGIKLLRWWMVRKARGRVLEVSCGTGRNARYYRPGDREGQVNEITMLDQSEGMMNIAEQRWKAYDPTFEHARFLTEPLSKHAIDDAPKGGYDTIVQTMGLCSTPDPVAHLKHIRSLVNENGRVLLLEHGAAYYGWLNKMLDDNAVKHARAHGCWWNRDFDAVLNACQDDFEIVKLNRFHFGTTWMIELRPKVKTTVVEPSKPTTSATVSKQ